MNRSIDLQGHAISRLTTALSVPAENVVPVQMAARSSDLDPRISVGATITTDRGNKLETVSGQVRVIVDGTDEFVKTNGTAGLSEIQAAVVDELTSHSPAWGAVGVSNQQPVAFDDSVNRHLGVVETTHERTDIHRTHQS
jgi:hypothetical protein